MSDPRERDLERRWLETGTAKDRDAYRRAVNRSSSKLKDLAYSFRLGPNLPERLMDETASLPAVFLTDFRKRVGDVVSDEGALLKSIATGSTEILGAEESPSDELLKLRSWLEGLPGVDQLEAQAKIALAVAERVYPGFAEMYPRDMGNDPRKFAMNIVVADSLRLLRSWVLEQSEVKGEELLYRIGSLLRITWDVEEQVNALELRMAIMEDHRTVQSDEAEAFRTFSYLDVFGEPPLYLEEVDVTLEDHHRRLRCASFAVRTAYHAIQMIPYAMNTATPVFDAEVLSPSFFSAAAMDAARALHLGRWQEDMDWAVLEVQNVVSRALNG